MADLKYLDTLQEVLLERGFPLDIAQSVLETVQTIDAVEVVRCKDCAKDGLPSCPIFVLEHQYQSSINNDPDFFCGYGERRKNV